MADFTAALITTSDLRERLERTTQVLERIVRDSSSTLGLVTLPPWIEDEITAAIAFARRPAPNTSR